MVILGGFRGSSLSKALVVSVFLAAPSLACTAGVAEEEAGSSSEALTVDKVGTDVTVLQAWIGVTVGVANPNGYRSGDVQIDPSNCRGTECSGEAEAVLESLLVGGYRYAPNSTGLCETVEVRTVTTKAAFDALSFRGLGFHYQEGRFAKSFFVAKTVLEMEAGSGSVTLADGTAALVHRFVFQGACFGMGGNGSSLYERHYSLKPYARFDDGADSFRVWDSVPTDYALGRSPNRSWVASFDRQSEVLAR